VIDKAKLRAKVRKLGHEYVFYMLDDAIELLSPAKLHQIARKYLDVESLRPDSENAATANLLVAVKTFDEASRAGDYYESFMVDSRNCTEQSMGTTAWIADFRRLLDRCVAEHRKIPPAESTEAFNVLFGLLDYIDECHDDVIFFADEGGAWQVGVDWAKVLPAWFRVLSATSSPAEYAERITTLLQHHCACESDKMVAIAREIANDPFALKRSVRAR
jgi:hypothetical protein